MKDQGSRIDIKCERHQIISNLSDEINNKKLA
jgi:hypothetical protein